MIGRSKELEDVGRVASSFPTNLAKIKATLLAGYKLRDIVPKRSYKFWYRPLQVLNNLSKMMKDASSVFFFSNLQ